MVYSDGLLRWFTHFMSVSISWLSIGVSNKEILPYCYNPRANGAKPGARVTNFALAEFKIVAHGR